MATETTLTIAAGRLRLELNPSVGGSISAFEWLGDGSERRILRKCNNRRENVLDAASFPLVPYVNRIRGGHFTFRRRDVRLEPNMAGDPSPLHGQGWLNPWDVEECGPARAVLGFRHKAGEWPWDFEARQDVALDEAGLFLRLTCRNTSDDPMPCGLGQHPYFPCGPQTIIDTAVSHAWTIDDQVLPMEKVPADGPFDLRCRLVCGQGLDHGFGGWSGTATMTDATWPYELRMSSPDARFFQLYSPPDGGIFVAEPVTHANAALNEPEEHWSELGLQVLQPREEMQLDMRLEVIPK